MPETKPTSRSTRHLTSRQYQRTDAQATYDVFYDAVHTGAADHYTRRERAAWVNSKVMPRSWVEKLADQFTRVALSEGRIVGFMSIETSGYLDMAYVLPSVMGQGVAERLYGEIETWARDQLIPLLSVQASHLARPFFQRHGWRLIGEQSVLRNGSELTNFEMDKQLI